MKREVILCA